MLFFLLDVLLNAPGRFVQLLPVYLATVVLALLVALTVHEFGHALAAHLLGDDTARRAGRLSLNPLRHLDPAGTFMLVVVGIGWGKPVPVNPAALPNARRGMALVAAAGPASNFVTAALLALPLQLGVVAFRSPIAALPGSIESPNLVPAMFGFLIFFNLLLGLFNLLPIAPLDGSKVLMGVAPSRLALQLARWEQYGVLVLVLLFALDWFSGQSLVWRVISTPADLLGSLFVGQPFL